MATTEQTKANSITQTVADTLGGTTYTTVSGDLCTTLHNGSKRVVVRAQADGTVDVVTDIDYGTYGASWCGSKSYRTTSGALRYARTFLRVA